MTAEGRAPLVLALDVGSSSVRAVLFDAEGRPAPGVVSRRDVWWLREPPDAMETDAEALLGLCVETLDEAHAAAVRLGAPVAAVATAAFWHSTVGIDASGRAATPLFGWGDVRGREEAAVLRARVDEGEARLRTGCWLHPSYPVARLPWLVARASDTFPRAGAWASFPELLGERLTGERRVSPSMASGTGMLDLRRLRWDAELLDAAGIRAHALSPVSDEAYGGLLPEWARRWPAFADALWLPALGDGACATLGSGGWGAGRSSLTLGTTGAVRAALPAGPEVPEGLWCMLLDGRRALAGRALSTGGSAFAWLRRTLVLPTDAELEAALAGMAPGAHGLMVLPVLAGERPPADARAWGATAGVTESTTALDVARAWLEAVALRLAEAMEAVERAAGPATEIAASGGALGASPAWARIVADAVGRPLRLPAREGEEAARGGALVALERLGLVADAAAVAAPPGDTLAPDAAAHALYRAARARQSALEAALAAVPATGPPPGANPDDLER